MNAPLKHAEIKFPAIDPLQVFEARCEARAILVTAGELGIHEAVDALQEYAEEAGIVATIGQDEVQAILAEAFEPGNSFDLARDVIEDNDTCCPTCGAVPCINQSFCALSREIDARRMPLKSKPETRPVLARSTIEAFRYVVRQDDAEQLSTWLARHSPDEIAALASLTVTVAA